MYIYIIIRTVTKYTNIQPHHSHYYTLHYTNKLIIKTRYYYIAYLNLTYCSYTQYLATRESGKETATAMY